MAYELLASAPEVVEVGFLLPLQMFNKVSPGHPGPCCLICLPCLVPSEKAPPIFLCACL